MLQFALSIYLCMAVVFGPALCCCSMDSLFASATAPSACGHEGGCNSHSKSHGHSAEGGNHHHGHSGQHSHDAPPAASDEVPAPCDHDPGKCPCGQHRQTMAASHPSDWVGQRSLDLQNDLFSILAVYVLSLTSLEQDDASTLRMGDIRPSGVYGREILRAYHKLQC
jgi:hypothetical protein